MANRPPNPEGKEQEKKSEAKQPENQSPQLLWQEPVRAEISAYISRKKKDMPNLKERCEAALRIYNNIPELRAAIADAIENEKNHSPERVKEIREYLFKLINEDPSVVDRQSVFEQATEKKPAETLTELAKSAVLDEQKKSDKALAGEPTAKELDLDDEDAIDNSLIQRAGIISDDPANYRGLLSRVYDKVYFQGSSLGEKLGWKNTTSDIDKVNDIELLLATCFDVDLVKQHQTMRGLLEGNKDDNNNIATILGILERRSREIKLTVEEQRVLELSRLTKMQRRNKHLGAGVDGGLSENQLETNFGSIVDELSQNGGYDEWSREDKERIKHKLIDLKLIRKLPIPGTTEEAEVNLLDACPINDATNFKYENYMKGVQKYQIGLQILGGLRDDAITGKHSENAGHSQFQEITNHDGVVQKFWMPVSGTMAINYCDSDVVKRSAREKAGSHVHECGAYDESRGLIVKFNFKSLRDRRKELMETRDFNSTNTRMMKSALGMSSREEPYVEEREEDGKIMPIFWLGGKKQANGEGGGYIYQALHNTYDKAMIDERGYPLTPDEAHDLFINDVIAPFLASNLYDWNMCLGSVVGGKVGYKPSEAVKLAPWAKAGENGFRVAIHQKGGKTIEFRDIHELIDYVNIRIKSDLIAGVKDLIAKPKPGKGDANDK